VTRHEKDIARLTQLAADVDAALGRREDTRGDRFAMTVGDRRHVRRAEAGEHLKEILEREVAAMDGRRESRVQVGRLAGFPLTASVERSLGRTSVAIIFDGAPRTSIQVPATDLGGADPAGLVARLENRIGRLEEHKTDALAGVQHARQEITHATESIGPAFPHAAQLTEARNRARQIDGQLQQLAAPQQPGEHADADAAAELTAGSAPGTGLDPDREAGQ
jgi:hypothetical protein